MKCISARDASELWGISERRIQKLCEEGRLSGVSRFGRSWAIPANTVKPHDARKRLVNASPANNHTNIRIESELYGNEMRILSQNDDCTVFWVENNTGNGVVTNYRVFPGITVFYNDFHMLEGFHHEKAAHKNIVEINHCREGRFECEFKSRQLAYLGEGDLAINVLANQPRTTYFPLSHYHGISVLIDIPTAVDTIENVASVLGKLKIDLYSFQEKLCDDCFIMRATDSVQHIFSELYEAPENLREGYLQLKIMELLLFLNSADLKKENAERQYFYKAHVDTVREIRDFLTSHLDSRITLSTLSERFNIPLTTMKTCFKGVYGTPVSTYIREYRMQTAAELLRTTNESVVSIAEKMGYKTSDKFAIAFQKFTNQTPSEYRRNFCLKG